MISLFDRVENSLGKGENAGYQHFSFSQCFSKPSFLGHKKLRLCGIELILSQMTNFKLFKTDRIRRYVNLKIDENGEFSNRVKTQWEKEKLLVVSNFSFCVFKRLLLQTHNKRAMMALELLT